ncbi:LysR family transcriptional regulator [Ramlibacter tataouinensis]|uniref:Transcriptional regulator, LysR family-like protein n=1 Tax=Ramlibacter tataouinensis (strain ATCC BAA-407 / DSM 14655 / LMG 21543 / TTB310) TaxID=365046 RepID=F5Y3L2_RAMTT|nr:LysR substrate-binding domain-containing protein [Ramlibacter tataouinensis]AEG92486.1 transcriptional regulator, LysR family-like protein [Ramlibacter tataouinensis TTB310]
MQEDGLAAQDEGGSDPRRGLNLRQIEVFRAVMLAGSVSAAGRMLYVSQPAISRMLALTESRLGFKLFERQRTRLSPTPEARRLFTEVEGLYRGVERVNDLARNLARSGAGSLRVVASASYGERLLPLALQRLVRRNPGAQLSCRNVTYDELAARFVTGDADIGISMVAPDHANLKAAELGRDRLVCLLPGDHPLADRPVVRPQDLQGTPWIAYPPSAPLGRVLAGWMGPQAQAGAAIEVHSPVTAIAFAQQGLGAALVVQWSLPPALAPGMVVRPVEPAASVGIWAVSSRLEPMPVLARRLLTALGHVLQAGPPHQI